MKKIDRQGYLAFFTFFALLFLLIVQIDWLFKAAKLEEQNFNHQVAIALKEARTSIGKRVPSCMSMNNCLQNNGNCEMVERKKSMKQIDSIIQSHLTNNNIRLKYTFEISDSMTNAQKRTFFSSSKCYQQSLSGLIDRSDILIKLQFPGRSQFLIGQLGGAFTLSILSILFVMGSFFITFRLFRKEREQAKRTTDFINNVVHEFQTPLANIRLASGLIRKKQKAQQPEKVDEYITVILSENEKMQHNVERILQLSSLENGTESLSVVNFHDIISSTSSSFFHRINEQNGSLTLSLNATNPMLEGDQSLFVLLVSNLVDNAIKYSKDKPALNISTFTKDNKLIVEFKDNGIGIQPKNISLIFDKYYRETQGDVHSVKGFGLGLTYVKSIVDRYKGSITVESNPEIGTNFIIEFPHYVAKN